MVARVPYPVTAPNYYAVASEVATIEYLRSCGIPAPEIYGYSADSDNAAGTPYILMEFVQGSKLGEVWPSLDDQEVISVVRQLTRLESRMMSLPFPAGGSLLHALRGRLFLHAGGPWEGETSELKTALIQATEKWRSFRAEKMCRVLSSWMPRTCAAR